jgi:hypothetical protein
MRKDILRKDTYPREKCPRKTISLGTKCVYKEKYLFQRWTSVLKRAFDRTQHLVKGSFKHVCHNDTNLINWPGLKTLGPVDKTVQ